jgi:DnaJ family protein C protein 13
MIRRFNANIPYSGLLYSTTQEVITRASEHIDMWAQGLFSENKERLIVNCIQSVMAESNQVPVDEMEAQLHCLRRLFASKAGFHAFTNVIGLREKLGTCIYVRRASVQLRCRRESSRSIASSA